MSSSNKILKEYISCLLNEIISQEDELVLWDWLQTNLPKYGFGNLEYYSSGRIWEREINEYKIRFAIYPYGRSDISFPSKNEPFYKINGLSYGANHKQNTFKDLWKYWNLNENLGNLIGVLEDVFKNPLTSKHLEKTNETP